MRIAIAGLFVLIHLLGCVKTFGIAVVPQLAQPISRALGFLWLAAASVASRPPPSFSSPVAAGGRSGPLRW